MRLTKKDLDQNSALQAACDTSITRVTAHILYFEVWHVSGTLICNSVLIAYIGQIRSPIHDLDPLGLAEPLVFYDLNDLDRFAGWEPYDVYPLSLAHQTDQMSIS